MQLVLKRDWEAFDVSSGAIKSATIPQGTHEVERIPNPVRSSGYWLVLKGTLIGASEKSWEQWKNGLLSNDPARPNFQKPIDFEEWEVQIIE